MTGHEDTGPRLLTLREVCDELRLKGKTVKRLMARGRFPRPIKTSDGVGVWTDEDIRDYKYRAINRHRFRADKPTTTTPEPKKPAGK